MQKPIRKKTKRIAQGYAPICQKMKDNQVFKSCVLRASSIMANASICRVGHPSSIPGSSTATPNKLRKY